LIPARITSRPIRPNPLIATLSFVMIKSPGTEWISELNHYFYRC
jgi:hypothetical protein